MSGGLSRARLERTHELMAGAKSLHDLADGWNMTKRTEKTWLLRIR